jgi:hypothetical protein
MLTLLSLCWILQNFSRGPVHVSRWGGKAPAGLRKLEPIVSTVKKLDISGHKRWTSWVVDNEQLGDARKLSLYTAIPTAGPKGAGLTWIGYGDVPELQTTIEASPFPQARVRHSVQDPQMHLHLARNGAGMTFVANWVQSVFPEMQRVPGTALDQRRSTWILLHGDLRRVRRARLLVDYLYGALQERRADFIGQ